MNRIRRTLIGGGAAALCWPAAVLAQEPRRIAKVTFIVTATWNSALHKQRMLAWFAELGYVDGRNLAYTLAEVNYPLGEVGKGRAESQALAVLATRPDVVLVPGAARLALFRQTPPEIPIVFLDAHADDIVPEYVANPAKPGGYLTGSAGHGSDDMPGKGWELLAELRPGLKRIGDFYSQESGALENDLRVQRIGNRSVARKLGVEYREIRVSEKREFAVAARAIQAAGVDGLGVAGHWWTWGEELLAFLERSGIAAVYEDPATVRRGGLLSFRNKDDECFRQGVEIAVRVLKGEAPGSIPVRFVERFHLAVNLRTARAMRLAVPSSILSRADETVR